jgi:hypothetical protein
MIMLFACKLPAIRLLIAANTPVSSRTNTRYVEGTAAVGNVLSESNPKRVARLTGCTRYPSLQRETPHPLFSIPVQPSSE